MVNSTLIKLLENLTKMQPGRIASTFANRTSQSSIQSLQKSLLCPPGKQKISPLKEKNKTLPTHSPTDKNVMIEIVEKLKGMSLDRKEGQLVTSGIFYCRDSAEINVCGSLQTSSRFDSDVLRNRQQKHTADR